MKKRRNSKCYVTVEQSELARITNIDDHTPLDTKGTQDGLSPIKKRTIPLPIPS